MKFLHFRSYYFGVILCASFILTDFIAPYAATYRNTHYSAQPPANVHFWHEKKWVGPFFYSKDQVPIKLVFFVPGERYEILGIFPAQMHLFGSADPTQMIALWGTDAFGRDLFSRILLGGRLSLILAMIASWLTIQLGLFMGAYSAIYGGLHDSLIQFVTEVLRGIPRIIILLLACNAIPIEFSEASRVMSLIIIFTVLGWFQIAKWIRTRTYFLVEEEFILCAKMLGASKMRILFLHVLPQLNRYKRLFWWQTIPATLITETTISFFGLGIREPESSWGLLLSEVNNLAALKSMPWLLLPGFFLVVTNVFFLWIAKREETADPREAG